MKTHAFPRCVSRVVALLLFLIGLLALAGVALAALPQPQAAMHSSQPLDGTVWNSGWVDIAPGETRTFTHTLGGDPALYAVDLWLRDTRSPGLGIHHRAYGGMNVAGQGSGVYWHNLTASAISVTRLSNDVAAGQIRLRLWIPEASDYDSDWRDIKPGQVLTLTHNLGGDVDDYVAGIKLYDDDPNGLGIHQFAFGGLEEGGVWVGAAWQRLGDTTIQVVRYRDDSTADQVRVFINRPDPADYDSGWVNVAQGETLALSHNLGGNPGSYVIRGAARATGFGINALGAGGLEAGGAYFGSNWQSLTNHGIAVFRQPNDLFAAQVRIRIWVPERKVYLPLILRNYPETGETELAYDSGQGVPDASWEQGKGFAVRFTPAETPATLVRARFYFFGPFAPIEVHVWDADHNDLMTPVTTSPAADGWFVVDLSAQNITVNGDFYVGYLHLTDYTPTLASDFSSPDGRSYEVDGAFWQQQTSKDYLIRAVVR